MLYSRLLLLFFTHSCTLRFGRFRGKLYLENFLGKRISPNLEIVKYKLLRFRRFRRSAQTEVNKNV